MDEAVNILFDYLVEEYDEQTITEMISDAIPDFVDDWEESYDSVESAYYETCNFEAEQEVLEDIIRAAKEKLDIDATDEEEGELMAMLADEWSINI